MALASFYLYFPEEHDAHGAARRLVADGFEVEVRLGADDVNWLTLAERDIGPDELERWEGELTRLAEERGGEYDGHEIDVGP